MTAPSHVVVCGVACRLMGDRLWVGEIAQLHLDVCQNADGYSVSLSAHRPHPWSTGELLCHVRRRDGAELRASARVALAARRAA